MALANKRLEPTAHPLASLTPAQPHAVRKKVGHLFFYLLKKICPITLQLPIFLSSHLVDFKVILKKIKSGRVLTIDAADLPSAKSLLKNPTVGGGLANTFWGTAQTCHPHSDPDAHSGQSTIKCIPSPRHKIKKKNTLFYHFLLQKRQIKIIRS